MKPATIAQLHDLTLEFYTHFAEEFSLTRHGAWPGWEQFATKLKSSFKNEQETLRVLDLGCGNGRFLNFLYLKLKNPLSYLGTDSNLKLLQQTKAVIQQTKVEGTAINWDVLQTLKEKSFPTELQRQEFDIITAFGLLHHIPSFEYRQQFISTIAQLLKNNGLLCISFWQFAQFERFDKKSLKPDQFDVSADDLESGDYLLGWGSDTTHARYCHSFTDEEIFRLISGTSLELIDSYSADGKEGKVNRYLVLRRRAQ